MPNLNGRRIAVVAIHGVGDHQPQEMAKAAAGLLASCGPAGGKHYSAFSENTVCARIEPVQLSRTPEDPSGAWGPLDALRLSNRKALRPSDAQQDSTDHIFMEGQLSEYETQGPEDKWEFLCMAGERNGLAGAAKKQVHIYDMYWSDLSGVGQAGLRIFGALYQLLFHLGSVGVNNVAAAAAYFRHEDSVAAKWDTFTWWQRSTAFMLALPIGLLNLILAGIAAALFVTASIAKVPVSHQAVAAGVAVIAVITGGWAYLLSQRGTTAGVWFRAPPIFALPAIIILLLTATGTVPLPQFTPEQELETSQGIIAVFLLTASLLACHWIAGIYEKRRPGALLVFRCLLGSLPVLTAVSVYYAPPIADRFAAMALLLRAGEVGFWMLLACWAVFSMAVTGAFFAGRSAASAVGPDEADRALRTNWTARLTIALPATIFLLITFSAWAGLLHACLPLLPLRTTPEQQHIFFYHPIPIPLLGKSGEMKIAGTWVSEAFWDAGLGFMPLLVILTGIAVLIALYATAPSVAGEVLSPPLGADPRASMALGDWLDRGFRSMRLAGRLLYGGVFVFPLVMVLGLVAADQDHFPCIAAFILQHKKSVFSFADSVGAVIGGGAIGVLAFGGRLSKLALGLRTGVRVALDVDNWLREHPKGTNPTVKICARYASLLRHIVAWRDENGCGYDALVIFAHSQGTVITADLLRFLKVEADAAAVANRRYDTALNNLWPMPKYLLTVGCPLRQLYGLRFPYLYGYAKKSATGGPDPADLGLKKWINAYRTGDYVGRSLWRVTNEYDPSAARFVNGLCEEFAVGPGAHTHYWDRTADRVAQELDALIAQA